MNKYKVKYSPIFYYDLDAIISYIKFDLKNEITANNLLNKIEEEIVFLLTNPLRYEKYETRAGNVFRIFYINNYIIFYTIYENIVEIRRIIYSKKDLEELF